MTVHSLLRVEGKDGLGPFVFGGPLNLYFYDAAFPTAFREGLCQSAGWRCGFQGFSMLHKWFTPRVLGRLLTCGYKVRRVFVMRADYGKLQVTFDSSAEVKGMYPQ